MSMESNWLAYLLAFVAVRDLLPARGLCFGGSVLRLLSRPWVDGTSDR